MIHFVRTLQHEVSQRRSFGARGAPWDFNLRDVFRWCELMRDEQRPPHWSPGQFADCLFVQRMRTEPDRQALLAPHPYPYP